ncbi:tropomyosin [Cladochytrium replicatum]|nr:tropomyosin [Cladochytrium replicatum]
MDKIKEKLEKLRIESDTHLARADKAEQESKQLKAELQKRDNDVQNLTNKVTLLQQDLERAEKRIDEVKLRKGEADKEDAQIEALQRKVTMLEHHLEEKEKGWREATDKARQYEMSAEQFERKSKQLDGEKLDLEKKLEEMTAKYNVVKAELESTLKGLEDL